MTKEEYEFVINRIFGGNSNGIIGDLSNRLCPILIVPLFLFAIHEVFQIFTKKVFQVERHSEI